MALPANIQRQKEEAERLEAEDMARLAKLEQEQAAGEQSNADPAQQEAQPEATPTNNEQANEGQPEPKQQEDPTAGLTAEIERLRKDNETLEQRWRTAQGMLSKRDGDMAESMRQMQAKLDALEKRAQEPVKPRENPAYRYLKPEEKKALEESGEDTLELRAAKGYVDTLREEFLAKREADNKAALEEFERKLAEREANAQAEQSAQASQSKLFDAVEKLSPGFTADDSTSGSNWRKFLDLPDPSSISGGTYRDRAVAMVQAGYAEGVASLHKEYKSLLPGGNRAKELEAQVKPPTSKASSTPKQTEDVISLPMYEAFYADKRAGRFRPNPDGTPMTAKQIGALQAKLDDWYIKEQIAGRLR